jgi:hypothetical protein
VNRKAPPAPRQAVLDIERNLVVWLPADYRKLLIDCDGGHVGDRALARMATIASQPARLLLILAAVAVLQLAGCATSLTMERISPTEHRADFVGEVKSAHLQPSGTVVVCVLGQRAHTPWPFGGGAVEGI